MTNNTQPDTVATITALSHDGRGIAHIDGKTVFIEGALPEEQVIFSYLKKRSQFSEAKVEKILQSAPERVTPVCPHFGVCAGCSLQHLAPDAQVRFKQQVLLDQFKRIAGIEIKADQLLPPIVATPTGYRRKARLSVKFVKAKNKVLVGFHESNGRFVADLQSCAILEPSIGLKIDALSELIAQLSIFNKIPQIEVACGDETRALIWRCLEPPTKEDQALLHVFSKKHNIIIYLQLGGLDSIRILGGQAEACPYEDAQILSYKLEDYSLEFLFAPQQFIQVNKLINQKMLAQALMLLSLNSQDKVLDLFCGLGNFSLPLARLTKEVIGVEGEVTLINSAKQNALHNNIANVYFYQADLTCDLKAQPWMQRNYSKIVLDPPRTGALNIMQYLPQLNANQILYVSCNPATLARDAKELLALGFKLNKIGILDMFPHTSHVETMAEFGRKV